MGAVRIDLSGKAAIVTGAGQGLGASIAGLLAEAGASVVVNYFAAPDGVNRQRAEQTAQEIGKSAVAMEADIRDPEALAQMFDQTVKQFGRVDIVVNNDGIIRDRTIKKMTQEEWQSVIDTNLTGTFNVCREAANKLADGGRIVNMSSIAGIVGFFGQTNYAASKAGVVGLTKSLSKELAKRQITVNAITPGLVLTEMGMMPEHLFREGGDEQ